MQKIFQEVLEKITPSEKEMRNEKLFAQELIKKISGTRGRHEKAELVGSIGRNTHLKGDNDLDIFVFYPESLERGNFEKEGLALGKAVFRGHKWEKAYSEHPYIRGKIKGFEVEIVPAYSIRNAEKLKSAVDRSAFHNNYLLQKIPGKEQEVRLLKQFMKGVKCYGADLGSNGFPGYVAELLVLKYGSFAKCVHAAANWKSGEIIDIEGQLTEEEAHKKFGSHFIVIDPVDRNRNVAAALSQNQYARFISACRAFAKKPSINFFFPKPHKPWPQKKLLAFLKKTELVAISVGYPSGIVEDMMWGQLRRLAKKISTACGTYGFTVERYSEWLEHKKRLIILLEVESAKLPKAKVLTGPEATDERNSQAFLKAHPKPLSGPRIEKARWVLEVEREYTEITQFLWGLLKKLKKEERKGVRKALRRGAKIMGEGEIAKLYRKSRGFSEFLTSYLKGEEDFLDY